MKTSLTLLSCLQLIVASFCAFSQINSQTHDWDFFLPDTLVYVDSSDTNNIWRIGTPNKPIFNSGVWGSENAIYTDSAYYPPNDTSAFLVKYIDHNVYYSIVLAFYYRMDSDTLKDFGGVSVFDGTQWIDLFTGDPMLGDFFITSANNGQGIYSSYSMPWPSVSPFTGSTQGWHEMHYRLKTFYHYWPETVLFRFEFMSDSVDNNMEGWMIDMIWIFEDWDAGVVEYPDGEVTLYPNPAHESVNFQGQGFINYRLQLFSLTGNSILDCVASTGKIIDISHFAPGTYLYIISQENSVMQRGLLVIQ